MQAAILTCCHDRQKGLFLAGRTVERGQCPDYVHCYLRSIDVDRTWNYITQEILGRNGPIGSEDELPELMDKQIDDEVRRASIASRNRAIGELIPNDEWWGEAKLMLQLCQLSQSAVAARLHACACSARKRCFHREDFFNLLRDIHLAVMSLAKEKVATAALPEPSLAVISYPALQVYLDHSTSRLYRHGNQNSPVHIPRGKQLTYLAVLVKAGANGSLLEGFVPGIDIDEPSERNAVQRWITPLRKLVKPLQLGIENPHRANRYILVDETPLLEHGQS
jgi:hypothetical protein